MATVSTPLPDFEAAQVPTSPQPSSEENLIKQEPPELTNTNVNNTSLPATPPFINSVTELRSLSAALSAFRRRYDELQGHLDFIKTSIDSKLPNHVTANPNQSVLIPLPDIKSSTAVETNVTTNPNHSAVISLPETSSLVPETTKQEERPNNTPNCEQEPDNQKPTRSELENLCETMSGRCVRRYLITHLSQLNKLRDEVPKALKFAQDPAKLVLECIGRFFLQGSKAYTKDSPMVPGREAAVLVLECFLLMGCDGVEIVKEIEGEAAKAAVAWKSRLMNESGLAKADEIDARGLLFLISGFGIPRVFRNEDIRDLIRASNVKGISGALRRSVVLIRKIPEIIEWMVKNKMEIEAVDIAYTLGFEDRCSPRTILTTFLRKKTNSRAQGSSAEVKEANKKQLADLKSVIKCLEAHNIDPSTLLPEWNFNEKILSLEKEIAELDKKAAAEKVMAKRKADQTESSKMLKIQEVKRSRFTGHNVPHQQKAAGHADGKSSYNGLVQTNSYLDGGLPVNYMNIYSASSSVLHGPPLPENVTGSRAAGAGLYGGGAPASLYAGGVHRGMVVDAVGQMVNHSNGQPYGWHGDAALNERLVGQTFSGQTHAPQPSSERLVGQTFSGQTYAPQPSSAGLISMYRSSTSSLEGFTGLQNPPATSVGVSAGGSASDLYGFADGVLESESYGTSGSRAGGGSIHPVLPAHHSSYLY